MTTPPLPPIHTPQAILDAMRLTDDTYVVGVFASRVTVRKQQIRALNLVWALTDSKRIAPDRGRVAIIGGGIAGVTAAAALSRIGVQHISILEKRPALCALQLGCDTRWLHPHVYDWPAPGSLRPVAGLPIMNWREGRASDVVDQLLYEWRLRKRAAKNKTDIVELLDVNHLAIDGRSIEWSGIHSDGRSAGGRSEFDVIIIAVGFGEEQSTMDYQATSYWRNEPLGQPRLDGPIQRYLISGTGDGGLVDLLRVRLSQFRQDSIISQLFDELKAKQRNATIAKLEDIRSRFVSDAISGGQLYGEFAGLSACDGLTVNVRGRLRRDTSAALLIRTPPSEPPQVARIFANRASFLHNFLVFLLYRAGGFTPRFGDLLTIKRGLYKPVVVRHGPNRIAHLEKLFPGRMSERLAEMNRASLSPSAGSAALASDALPPPQIATDEAAFPASWWDTWSSPQSSWRQEYAPAATVVLATSFAAALYGALDVDDTSQFRATLHRTVGSSPHAVVQQIAYYSGTRGLEGRPYRAFPTERGVIGYAMSVRQPVRSWKPPEQDDQAFRQALRADVETLELGRSGAQPMDERVGSLFACPVLGKARKPLLVLFADANDANFFTDERCRRLVAALSGLCRYLESATSSSEIMAVQSILGPVAPKLRGTGTLSTFEIVPVAVPRVRLSVVDFEWRATPVLAFGGTY